MKNRNLPVLGGSGRGALLAAALGIVLTCSFSRLSFAQSCEGDLYVAVTGDPLFGDGSEGNPYRTITPAIARAREIRSVCADPIIIHVGPGDYVGDSNQVGTLTVDALPIVLDVPDLDLRGATVLTMDANGLPTGTFSSATTVSLDPTDDITNGISVFFITPSDTGGAANGVTIEGFVIKGNTTNDPTFGIAVDRVQRFVCRSNLITAFYGGIVTRASSGLIEANYLTQNGAGALVTGGNGSYPATVTVTKNRATANEGHGQLFNAAGDNIFPPSSNPRPQNTVTTTFDTLSAVATYNDSSNNGASGLRLMHFGQAPSTATTHLTATIHHNRIDSNPFGVLIDEGIVERGRAITQPGALHYTSSLTANFWNNVVSNSSAGPALFSFTRYTSSLIPQELLFSTTSLPPEEYVQSSSDTITHTGELNGLWIDHPAQDPVDCRTLCNHLQINGVEMPPPIRSPELGPPFMSVLACPPPTACP